MNARRWFRDLRNALAVLGLGAIALAAYVYTQGYRGLQQTDPGAVEVMGLLAQRTLQKDMASATVVRIPLNEGVGIREAVRAMKARAEALDLRFVDEHRIYRGAGRDSPYRLIRVFEYCDPDSVRELLEYNPDFAAYVPCQLALVQARDGRAWFVTLDLNLLVYGGRAMAPEAKLRTLQIKEALLDIMSAGASGG